MKRITFDFLPGYGSACTLETVEHRLRREFGVREGSTVIEEVPDPVSNVIQTFEIERPSDDRLSAFDLFTALQRQGFNLTVAVNEVKK